MRKYSKICPSLWTGKTGRALRGNLEAMLVRDYLLTGPMTSMTGVYYCSVYYICADVGLTPEAVNQALQSLISVGFCLYDWNSEWVFVKNMARFQVAQELKASDKRVIQLRKDVEQMPEPFKSMFIDEYNDIFCLDCLVPTESAQTLNLFEAPSMPLRSQEQEQEQEQKQHQEQANPADDLTRGNEEGVETSACLLKKDLKEDSILTLEDMVAVAKDNGIQLASNQTLEKIAQAKTITLALFLKSIKRWKETSKPSGYFIGILTSVANGFSISDHDQSSHKELTAENITEAQAWRFAKQLAQYHPFASRFAWSGEEMNVFIARMAKEIKESNKFEEFSPYMKKLNLIEQGA